MTAQSSTSNAASPTLSNECSLKAGDRVVFLDSRFGHEDVPEYGTVRWVGTLEDLDARYDQTLAGVEFYNAAFQDNPIGGGTGRFCGHQIFRAELNHASFVPLIGLMKERDFKANEQEMTRRLSKVSLTNQDSITDIQVHRSHSSASAVIAGGMTHEYTLGSCVEVDINERPTYGVIRYIGDRTTDGDRLIGIELEEDLPLSWAERSDGWLGDRQRFVCTHRRGLFALRSKIRPDQRFQTPVLTDFGHLDSGIITEYTPPQSSKAELHTYCGSYKGIQGHQNSCYLDTTLYVMFAHTAVFDHILTRKRDRKNDIKEYDELLRVLATEIVYPLRRHSYVRADHVSTFRRLIAEALPDIKGFQTEERDPEELLTVLFTRLFKPKPYLCIRHEDKDSWQHFCPLVKQAWSSPTDDDSGIPDVQFLLERSYFESQLRFAKAPRILIIQLPRSGPDRAYSFVAPNETLDLTSMLHNRPTPCTNAGHLTTCTKVAHYFCSECYMTKCRYMAGASFCPECYGMTHQDHDHMPNRIPVEKTIFQQMSARRLPVRRHTVKLSAVLCIESSHYVAFAKSPRDSWLFYDSFADLLVPEVRACDDIAPYLTTEGHEQVRANIVHGNEHSLPKNVIRLLKDAYVCFYYASDAEQYLR